VSSRAMLHYKDQVSPTCMEGDLRLRFQRGVNRAQYIGNLSWFKCSICISCSWQCASYFESFPDASKVILVFQIHIQAKSYIAKYNADAETESFLNPNSCHCY